MPSFKGGIFVLILLRHSDENSHQNQQDNI